MTKKTEVKMLTAREFAEQTGAGESSVRLWAKEGKLVGAKLEATPVGSFWLIPETLLHGFIKPSRGRPAGTKTNVSPQIISSKRSLTKTGKGGQKA
jgi:hypothetical protein